MVLCFLCATVVVFIFLLVLILHCYNLICYKNVGCLKIKPGVICPYCHKCSLSRCVSDCALCFFYENLKTQEFSSICIIVILWCYHCELLLFLPMWGNVDKTVFYVKLIFWAYTFFEHLEIELFLATFPPCIFLLCVCVRERERTHVLICQTLGTGSFFLIAVCYLLN